MENNSHKLHFYNANRFEGVYCNTKIYILWHIMSYVKVAQKMMKEFHAETLKTQRKKKQKRAGHRCVSVFAFSDITVASQIFLLFLAKHQYILLILSEVFLQIDPLDFSQKIA